jgi:hypothetical protein
MSLKNPVTPPGIDPVTVRQVEQCLTTLPQAPKGYKYLRILLQVPKIVIKSTL